MTKALYMSPLTILAIYAVTFSNEPDVDHITNLTNTPIEFNDGQTYADEHQWEEELELKSLKKPVRKFLQANPNIEEFTESCSSIDECHDYYFLSKDYELDFAPEDVFETFVTTKPQELWSGSARFQLSYEPEANEVYTHVEDAPMVTEDMIIALNLKVFGLTSIPVVFKIVTLDKEAGLIEFSYVQENKSQGIQSIHVKDNGNGGTLITHQTRYYSGKKFRDKTLYPFIHHKFTGGFYKNLKHLVDEQVNPD